MTATDESLLCVRGIAKRFPGVIALQDVELTLQSGEVLAVVGENGAGKSTLMKILAGVESPDAGEIRLDGRPVTVDSVQRALELGIVLIHQELNLADNLDVAANIFLGREPHRLGWIDKRSCYRQAQQLIERVGLDVSPRTLVARLSVGQQQMVEIAKALSVQARILIMDEPTSSLSKREAERLFAVIEQLRRQGVSIVYISHRLGEVKRLADRVLVLRDGRNAGMLRQGEIEHDRLVQMMVGRDLGAFYQRLPHQRGEVAFEVEDLVVPQNPAEKISFAIHRGEVVGIAGLVGAGRTELLQTLFGVQQPLGGTIRVQQQTVSLQSPRDAIRAGMALVPEDRKEQGLILEMAVDTNLCLAGAHRWQSPPPFINRREERRISQEMIGRLAIKTPSPRQVANYLSGGNQQKVVLGKWLALEPQVLLLDEPTRGVDIGAKEEIYRLMEELAAGGVAVLFVSSEMEEIIGMADRVLVMHQGRITGQLDRAQLGEQAIMHLATGGAARHEQLA